MIVPVPHWLQNLGLAGERRALSLLCLSLLMAFYLLLGLTALGNAPPIAPYLIAMGAVYALAFFAVGAEWFWARWFAIGIAWSGVLESALGLLTVLRQRDDFPPELLKLFVIFFAVLGGLHALAGASLLGPRVAERYDARPDWRERWQLDEQGVLKVRRTVTRAATSLPMLIALALAPRQDQSLAFLGALGLCGLGLFAVLRGRVVGVLTLGAASAMALGAALTAPLRFAALDAGAASPLLPSTFVPMMPLLAAGLLLLAFAPFARPVLAHLSGRDRA